MAGDPAQLTGGYVYDARIVDALRARGWSVEVIGLAGQFPAPDVVARAAFADALAALPAGTRVVVDGLVMGGLPEVIGAHRGRLRMVALVHHLLGDEHGVDAAQRAVFLRSEAAALALVGRIITTSAYTARRLADFVLLPIPIDVVEPGVDAAPLAAAEGAPARLLCVASVTARKGHEVLLAALAGLRDLGWQCDFVGSLSRDPVHAAQVEALIRRYQLDARVRLCGEQTPLELQRTYAEADVFVLASHYEGYGMVISEALARGLPVVATRGGALAETVPSGAGLLVPPGDAAALAAALRRVLVEPGLRRELRAGARRARLTLRAWADAAAGFEAALDAALEAVPDGKTDVAPGAPSAPAIFAHDLQTQAAHADATFSVDWLALRAAPDARARDAGLTVLAQQWLSARQQQRESLRLLDLGTGSGANPCFLAARLPGPQVWTLFDHDVALLERAAARSADWRDLDGRPVDIHVVKGDLARLGAEDLAGVDLLTASALLDLVDAGWLERLALGCRQAACAVLITLSVDGCWRLSGGDGGYEESEDDAFVRSAFNAHQRGDKGVGGALGPDAAPMLAALLTAQGYAVRLAPSPWRLHMSDAGEQALAKALLEGWRKAAQAQCAAAAARIDAWYARRCESVLDPAVRLEVGHVDLLALPAAGFVSGGFDASAVE